MISFETYSEIRFLRECKKMSCSEIAECLHINPKTVQRWSSCEQYKRRKTTARESILEIYKPAIIRDWNLGGSLGSNIYRRLLQAGYTGGISIVRSYLRRIRGIRASSDSQVVLPCEWMLCLLQGKLSVRLLASEINPSVSSRDLAILIGRIRSGPLRVRNMALAILASFKGIPLQAIARFLKINNKTVSGYVQRYLRVGIDKLFISSKEGEHKHEQQCNKDAVFALLHSPPRDHGVNRTSWRMDDLKRVLQEQGVFINKSSIHLIIKDAGFRFRSAKKVLTSTDPQYQQKLAEITRILSTLTESQRFFSIDEYGPFAVKIQGGRALTAPGEDRIVPQFQKSKGSLILVGALELSTNQITHFYSNRKSTAEMIQLMHLLLIQYHNKSILYLSWDAASWHVSKAFVAEVGRVNTGEYRSTNQTPAVTLAPLPSCAQFLNVIESVFSGMAKAIIHNSDYASVEECKNSIDLYLAERNQVFKDNPKRAGNKIWGKERVPSVFNPCNNCKDPNYR